MAKDLVGTPIKCVLDGNTFFYMADADIADGKPLYTGTPLPHSGGGNMWQQTLQDTGSSGHAIKANGDELQILKELAERGESFPMSYTNRAGDTYRADGHITYDTRSNANGRVELTLIPDLDWTPFIA
jgi:hypothetical protein